MFRRAAVFLAIAVSGLSGTPGSPAAAAQSAPFDLSASGAGGSKTRDETKHLTVRTSTSVATASPGSRLELRLDVTPKPKMHVYAPGQKDVIPVSLTLRDVEGVRAAQTAFPPAEKYFFAPLEETQLVYSKPFRLTRSITLSRSAGLPGAAGGTGTLTIEGTFEYQACDDAICYLPQKVPVSWTIEVGR